MVKDLLLMRFTQHFIRLMKKHFFIVKDHWTYRIFLWPECAVTSAKAYGLFFSGNKITLERSPRPKWLSTLSAQGWTFQGILLSCTYGICWYSIILWSSGLVKKKAHITCKTCFSMILMVRLNWNFQVPNLKSRKNLTIPDLKIQDGCLAHHQ